jgi:hypothetical protein
MRATRSTLAAAIFAAAFSLFAASSNPPPVNLPDWMQQAAAKPLGTYSAETEAVVLMDETSIRVLSADQFIEHRRKVVKILRPEGRDEATFFTTIRDKDKASDLHAWGIDASGHKFEVKTKEFNSTAKYQEELYTDIKTMYATVPGAGVGGVFAFEYDVLNQTYLDEFDWIPQRSTPVKDASLTIELPPSWEFNAVWANSENIKPQALGANKWKWAISDVPALEEEPLRPSADALAKRLEVAFFGGGIKPNTGSWANIGTWYKGLSDPRRTSTPEIRAAAQTLALGRSGFDAQVRAVATFLQTDVRYVAISIGIGGHQPHFASDVFRHKYGDCKDKAALMATMLEEIGYHSEMVLVDTDRGSVKPEVPCVRFNHAIIAIQLPTSVPDDAYPSMVKTKSGFRYVIFDPTNSYTPFGLIPYYEQNSYALIATSPGELVRLPLIRPEISGNEYAGKFALGIDGILSGDVVEKLTGESASRLRGSLAEYDGKDRSKFLEIVANSSLKQASVEAPEFENLKAIDKELIIKYKLKMSGYAQHAGALLLVRPRVLGDKMLDLPKKKRNYDLELSTSRHDRDIYEITIPSGYVIDELPENTHIDVGFAMYDAKIEPVGNAIRYTREYVVRDPQIAISKIDDVKRLQNAIGADQFATAVLKKAP